MYDTIERLNQEMDEAELQAELAITTYDTPDHLGINFDRSTELELRAFGINPIAYFVQSDLDY